MTARDELEIDVAIGVVATLSFTQRGHEAPSLAKPLALAIILSWIVMFGRVLVEVAVVNTPLLRSLLLPMLGTAVVALLFAVFLFWRQHTTEKGEAITIKNPFELRPAITFGLLYAVVLFISWVAELTLSIVLSRLLLVCRNWFNRLSFKKQNQFKTTR